MADIGEAVLAGLDALAAKGEPSSPVDSYRGRTARMRALEKEHGGERQAADAVGVTLRTWRRWANKGARLAPPSLRKLVSAYGDFRAQVLRRRLARLRNAPYACGRIRWRNSDRKYMQKDNGQRCVSFWNLRGADASALFQPWLDRDGPAAGEAFERLVTEGEGYEWSDPQAEGYDPREDDRILFHGDACSVTF